ncbi:MAG: diguanylate cyclase (GGDEF)-like protein [Paraglaciecola sp.]
MHSTTPQTKARFTLVKKFTGAMLGILILFIVLSSLTYYRLIDLEGILVSITDTKLPRVALSGQLYGQVNSLTASAEMLSKATSKASHRIAEQEITNKINIIKELSSKQIENESLAMQLDVIRIELDDFSTLIKHKLLIEEKLHQMQQDFYQLHDDVLAIPSTQGLNASATKDENLWRLNFSDLIASAGQGLTKKKLQEVRQIFKTLTLKLTKLQNQTQQLSNDALPRSRYFIGQLSLMLDEENGLLSLKIAQLRLAGRTIGRAIFLRNLIGDYASLVEVAANEIDRAVIVDAQSAAQRVKQQTRNFGLIFIVVIIFVAATIFLIQKQVIRRLVILNLLVKDKLAGSDRIRNLKGNDEISDIADTFNLFARTIEEQKKTLQHLSLSDGLTGIGNRRAVDERLIHEIQLSVRQKWPVSLLLLDVDFFKAYNDSLGHTHGDKCLQAIAKMISQSMLRKVDFVARYGGEEFICILPDTNEAGASEIAERVQVKIAEMKIPHGKSQVSPYITMSVGIATSSGEQISSPDELIKNADNALYKAKSKGRNCIIRHSELGD